MRKKLFFVGAMLVVSSNIFAQQEQESTIDEVTIASRTRQQLYKTGKNVQLITAKDLEKQQGKSLTEVLNQVAGFHTVGNYGNSPEPKALKIRGGKSANILILLDGIPLKDVTGNDYTLSDLRLLALENIESIEILNGVSSVLYGSNATVSVINIKTKHTSVKSIEGILSARAGSFSTYGQNALIKGRWKQFGYQVSGFNEKSEGISSAAGKDFEKDGFEKQNFNAQVGYLGEALQANISAGWQHHLFDYDGGAFTDAEYRSDDRQHYVSANAGYRYKNGEITFNARFSGNERLGESWLNNRYEDQFSYTGRNFFAELFNNYRFSEFASITAGVQYEDQRMGAKSLPWGESGLHDDLFIDGTTLHHFDVFANLQLSYKSLHADAGVRMTENSKFGNYWVYSLNPYLLKETSELFFKAGYSYSTAFIAPTLYQNYGSLPYVLPNFGLTPETNSAHEINLSAGKKDRSLSITASLFYRDEQDAFAYETVDYTTYAGQFRNIAQNSAKGFEIGADYQPVRQLRFGGNFSFTEKEENTTMLRQPKQRVNSYLDLQLLKNTQILLNHQFISSRTDSYYDGSTFSVKEVTLEPYHVFSLNVQQKIRPHVEAYLHVGNLFNERYVDIVGYRVKPRHYTFGVNYRF